jgi:tetratricopeptide (TPR) repeat protein
LYGNSKPTVFLRHEVAVVALRQAVALNPGDASVHLRLATELKATGSYEEEIQAYEAALTIIPTEQYLLAAATAGDAVAADQFANGAGSADVLTRAALAALLPRGSSSSSEGGGSHARTVRQIAQLNRCVALERLARNGNALDCYDKLLTTAPDYPRALANRATVLYSLSRAAEAVAGYDAALAAAAAAAGAGEISKPTLASWLNNRGFVLGSLAKENGAADKESSLRREQEAIECFRAAVGLEAEEEEEGKSGFVSDGRAAANLVRFENRQREREMAAATAGAEATATKAQVAAAKVEEDDAASGGVSQSGPAIIRHASELVNLAQKQRQGKTRE